MVEVTEANGRFRVTIGEEVSEVDARLPAQGIYSLLIGGISYVADVKEEDGWFLVDVNGESYRIRVEAETRHILKRRGLESVFTLSGLERPLPLEARELPFADDEIAPALYGERLRDLALEHLGGSSRVHDVMLFNRLTAATIATHLALVKDGDVVVGVSPSYSHPTLVRAATHVGARFVDTSSLDSLQTALEREGRVTLVALPRLAVPYALLPLEVIREVVRLAHEKGALVYVDDAGGARVGPAVFGQPKMLELGVDVGATGLDKYGTSGPRLGLLAGERRLVEKIRARAFEFGLEARPMLYPAAVRSLEGYTPERVRDLVNATKQVAAAAG